jgi:hypothetical protein
LTNTVVPPASGSPRPARVAGPEPVRIGLVLLAIFLAASSTWLVVSDLLRSGPIGIAVNRTDPAAAKSYETALLAAQVGSIRGSLWADAAFADAATLPWPMRSAQTDRALADRIDRTRAEMETSLGLAPINAEGWLLLAALPSVPSRNDPRITDLLGMAYFTAPSAAWLAPWRIERAASSAALADPDIQNFVKADMRRILAGPPQQKAAIVTAYRNALPQNQARFEALVADIDPSFAQTLRNEPAR